MQLLHISQGNLSFLGHDLDLWASLMMDRSQTQQPNNLSQYLDEKRQKQQALHATYKDETNLLSCTHHELLDLGYVVTIFYVHFELIHV